MAEPIFPKSEFDGRYGRARKLMAEAGFQAIVAYSPGNQFWLSGFRGSAGARARRKMKRRLEYEARKVSR